MNFIGNISRNAIPMLCSVNATLQLLAYPTISIAIKFRMSTTRVDNYGIILPQISPLPIHAILEVVSMQAHTSQHTCIPSNNDQF